MEQIKKMEALFSTVTEDDPVYNYFEKKSGSRYCLVPADSISDCEYDKVNQRLTFIIPSEEKDIFAVINYSKITIGAIKYIEALAKTDFESRWFIGEADSRGFIPLSMITERGIENFYFSAPPGTGAPGENAPKANDSGAQP
jgi:hypothetical protein